MGGGNSKGKFKENNLITIQPDENLKEKSKENLIENPIERPIEKPIERPIENPIENLIKIEVLNKVVEKLSELEETFSSYHHSSEQIKNLLFLKDIDLIDALDAVVYKLEITNELCNINNVISKVEKGFSKLKCTQSICNQNAIMYVKLDEDTPAQLYCEGHLRLVDAPDDVQYFLDEELEEDIEVLESLEKLLIFLQEQMEFIINEDADKQYLAYKKVKNPIDDEYKSLKNTLKDITTKTERINKFEMKANQIPQYEPLSFVRPDSKRCIENIINILKIIFEINTKIEINQILEKILAWSRRSKNSKEEFKTDKIYSIPKELYGKAFKLCRFPTQVYEKIKEMERNIKSMAKEAIEYQKKTEEYTIAIGAANKILKDEIQKQQNRKNEEIKKCALLLNAEFLHYLLTLLVVGNIRTQSSSSHSLFRQGFTESSGVYKRLGQFDYGQPNCTTDHIKTCIGFNWIYIGEVKEGTDDTPHGIGIKVWRYGDIREGYWKDGKLHGRGRAICASIGYDGRYYIGEFKEGKHNGEGTYYTEDGHKYTGIWDGNKGQGEINYKDGKKYKGQWNYLKGGDSKYEYMRHGVGTLYSANGQVLNQGKWEKNEYKGNE